jgi:hypothetical protein
MEMKNPHVIWAAVIIVFMLVAGAVTLVALDKDVTVILSLAGLVAVPVLSAFGVAVYQKLDQVKEASNGNLARVMEMQQKTQAQLTQLALLLPAQQVPPAEGSEAVPPQLREDIYLYADPSGSGYREGHPPTSAPPAQAS